MSWSKQCYSKMQVLCSVSCAMITLLCKVRSCECNAFNEMGYKITSQHKYITFHILALTRDKNFVVACIILALSIQ